MEQVLRLFYKAFCSAINGTQAQRELIPHALRDLIKLETHPVRLTEIAYDLCSVICENRQSLEDWEGLLLTALEIGFRHPDSQVRYIEARLVHTQHHLEMIDAIFGSQQSEAIADLLHAWTISVTPAYRFLGACTERLVCLQNLMPFSPRLRQLVMRSVLFVGYDGFKGVGVERFIGLLNHLRVTVEDIKSRSEWEKILLKTLQTSEGAQHLSYQYWELLVELVISPSPLPRPRLPYNPQIMISLTEAQEWKKLECWMGIVCVVWPSGADGTTEDFEHSMVLLFRQRPSAFQKLERWMEQWSQRNNEDIPESFQRICKQAQGAVQRDAP